jgi:hypothetical protein
MRPSKKIAEANQVKLPEPEKKKSFKAKPKKGNLHGFFQSVRLFNSSTISINL